MRTWLLSIVQGLFIISSAKEVRQWEEEWEGTCSLFEAAMTAFELPVLAALIDIKVEIVLRRKEQNLSEYPTIRPVAFLRFDAVASETRYDGTGAFGDTGVWEWYQWRPVKANTLFVRVDGGLNSAFQLQCGYSLSSWNVSMKVRYRYCDNGWEVSGETDECSVRIWNVLEGVEYHMNQVYYPAIFEVPEQASEFTILILYNSPQTIVFLNPRNYLDFQSSDNPETYRLDTNLSHALTVLDPRYGSWYIQIFNQFNVSIDFSLVLKLRKSDFPELVLSKDSHTVTPSLTFSQYFINGYSRKDVWTQFFFFAKKTTLGHKYTLSLAFPQVIEAELGNVQIVLSRGSPNMSQSSFFSLPNLRSDLASVSWLQEPDSLLVLIDLGLLYSGRIYLSLKVSNPAFSYGIGIASSECGYNPCNGDPCEMMDGDVDTFVCNCNRHHTGLNCEKTAFSDAKYVLWVLCLMVSNLAMGPAVYLAFRKYGKYGEGCIYLSTMFTSLIYHACDSHFFCFGLQSSGLRHTDFYLSYLSIDVSIIYLARIRQGDVKLGCVLLAVVLLLYSGYQTQFSSLAAQIWVTLTVAVIPITRYGIVIWNYRKATNAGFWNIFLRFFFKNRNFRWSYGSLAMCSFVLGLGSRMWNTNYDYWIVSDMQTHSLWHLFIMLTPAFILCVFPAGKVDAEFSVANETGSTEPLLGFTNTDS